MNSVHGLHHITAIAGPAQENLDFYAGILGMRLVKRSVNQDDPGTYHLFYADAEAIRAPISRSSRGRRWRRRALGHGLPSRSGWRCRLGAWPAGARVSSITASGAGGSRRASAIRCCRSSTSHGLRLLWSRAAGRHARSHRGMSARLPRNDQIRGCSARSSGSGTRAGHAEFLRRRAGVSSMLARRERLDPLRFRGSAGVVDIRETPGRAARRVGRRQRASSGLAR